MISVSSDYKNYISDNTAVSAQNKIIVDGVEYLGDVLKTYPKISHSSSKICGSFPVKTVSFEIYDLENCLDFEGKEIEVYKGLMLNGEPYYVKQGIFVPQKKDITTNISNRSIKFDKVQDKTQFLEDTYKSDLDWSNGQRHTGLEIVQEICTKKRITLKNNNFAFANYLFKQPNFPSSITYRQVLSRLAEIGGEIVIFNYEGQLEFKSQYNTEDIIGRDRFEKISEEKTITYNSVVLGKEGINDDIVYPNPYSETRVSLRIEDNPFVDLYREEMIEEVASHIIGLSYTSFEARNVMDGFIYELNDVISITDRNNNILRAVILDLNNTSRIKSDLKLNLNLKDTTKYELAGSNKAELNEVKLNVDHINNEIVGLVKKVDNVNQTIIETTNELVEDAISGLNNIFTTTGGNNIFRNTDLAETDENGYTYWTGTANKTSYVESTNKIAILLQNGSFKQNVPVPNGIYMVGFIYDELIQNTNASFKLNGTSFSLDESGSIEQQIEVTTNSIELEFICDTNNGFRIYDLRGNKGDTLLPYSQNSNESRSDTVTIGKGITIKSDSSNTLRKIDADGDRTYNATTNELVREDTDEGSTLKTIYVKENAKITGLTFTRIDDNRTWISGV